MTLALVSCLKDFEDTGFTPEKAVMAWTGAPEGEFVSDAATVEVKLNSNLPWRITSCPTWITVTPVRGTGDETLTVSIQRNRTVEKRTGLVRASVTKDQFTELTIVQDGSASGESIAYYVKENGDPEASGLSWGSATTLAKAIDSVADGDTICVAAGRYAPEVFLTGSDTALESNRTFEIHSNFLLVGGFPANADDASTTFDDYDPSLNLTVLTGALENGKACHVVTVTAAKVDGKKALIKGFTITEGCDGEAESEAAYVINGATYKTTLGGGVMVGPSVVDFVDCIISGNEAKTHAAGCYLMPGGLVSMTNVRISNNTAALNGGGIWNSGATLYMDACTVCDNISGAQAAGYYSIDSNGSPSISRIYNSTFSGNDCTTQQVSRSGGGAYIREYSDAVFVNCTFCGNKAGNGGGIEGYGANGKASTIKLISCTFTGNHADLVGGGVCLWNTFNTTEIYNCIISGNTAGDGADIGYSANVKTEPTLGYTTTIVGDKLYSTTGASISGWSFAPATMLCEFGLWGGKTMTCPLVDDAANPAVSQGMTKDQLVGIGAALNPAVAASVFDTDQRGRERSGNNIGSCTVK